MEFDMSQPHVKVVITYDDHRYRLVYATEIFQSQAGKTCIRAWDPDVDDGKGGWRTFREDRLKGMRFVKD